MKLVKKYRPKNFSEVKGQSHILPLIINAISHDQRPHMLFVGSSGTGKTSVAECIARKLFGEGWRSKYTELNASDDRGIDVVRGIIKRLSKIRGNRIVLLDEADNLTQDAQQALRRTMEQAVGTMFILTGNREWKIIDAIKSRCAVFRFKRLSNVDIMRRLWEVCDGEGLKITSEMKEGFLALVASSNGDLRRALNCLETIIGEGKTISPEVVASFQKPKIAGEALKIAVAGDFERGKELFEDAYINSNFMVDEMLMELYETIGDLNVKNPVKARLYARLAEAERSCRIGSNPLLQLIGFLSFSWVVRHLPEGCPALDEKS